MPITLADDDGQPTIMHVVYRDPWTWDQFISTGDQMLKRLDEAKENVAIIVDMTDSQQVPGGMPSWLLHHMGHVGPIAHPRTDVLVIVASPTISLPGASLLKKLAPLYSSKVEVAPTLEQAHALIAQRRSSANPA